MLAEQAHWVETDHGSDIHGQAEDIDARMGSFNAVKGWPEESREKMHPQTNRNPAQGELDGCGCQVLRWGMKRLKYQRREGNPAEGSREILEKQYIEEYLLRKGYRWADLKGLPEKEARLLMVQASTYASLKLANIEARSRFRKKIHWP